MQQVLEAQCVKCCGCNGGAHQYEVSIHGRWGQGWKKYGIRQMTSMNRMKPGEERKVAGIGHIVNQELLEARGTWMV